MGRSRITISIQHIRIYIYRVTATLHRTIISLLLLRSQWKSIPLFCSHIFLFSNINDVICLRSPHAVTHAHEFSSEQWWLVAVFFYSSFHPSVSWKPSTFFVVLLLYCRARKMCSIKICIHIVPTERRRRWWLLLRSSWMHVAHIAFTQMRFSDASLIARHTDSIRSYEFLAQSILNWFGWIWWRRALQLRVSIENRQRLHDTLLFVRIWIVMLYIEWLL